MIQFTVLGEPVAQGRPRATTVGSRIRMYDPAKSSNYKEYVRLTASTYAPAELLTGAVGMMLIVYRPIPKSFSKKKAAEAEAGRIRPTVKPDADNYLKGVKDALKGVIWQDDNQVVDVFVSKRYSNKPRIEVKIQTL